MSKDNVSDNKDKNVPQKKINDSVTNNNHSKKLVGINPKNSVNTSSNESFSYKDIVCNKLPKVEAQNDLNNSSKNYSGGIKKNNCGNSTSTSRRLNQVVINNNQQKVEVKKSVIKRINGNAKNYMAMAPDFCLKSLWQHFFEEQHQNAAYVIQYIFSGVGTLITDAPWSSLSGSYSLAIKLTNHLFNEINSSVYINNILTKYFGIASWLIDHSKVHFPLLTVKATACFVNYLSQLKGLDAQQISKTLLFLGKLSASGFLPPVGLKKDFPVYQLALLSLFQRLSINKRTITKDLAKALYGVGFVYLAIMYENNRSNIASISPCFAEITADTILAQIKSIDIPSLVKKKKLTFAEQCNLSQILFAESVFNLISKPAKNVNYNQLIMTRPTSSKSHKRLSNILKTMLIQFNKRRDNDAIIKAENEYFACGFFIDIVLTQNEKVVAIIELNGPTHYNAKNQLHYKDKVREFLLLQHFGLNKKFYMNFKLENRSNNVRFKNQMENLLPLLTKATKKKQDYYQNYNRYLSYTPKKHENNLPANNDNAFNMKKLRSRL